MEVKLLSVYDLPTHQSLPIAYQLSIIYYFAQIDMTSIVGEILTNTAAIH